MRVDIEKCSKIGFGCYRVSCRNPTHVKAFKLAIDSGCNLVDTSSNYTGGNSENLIGSFVRENPDTPLFIVTKGGYIEGKDNIAQALKLRQKGKLNNYTTIDESFHHSIAPDFLETQFQQSCDRLGRSQIDAYLLHNPEYFIQHNEGIHHSIYDHIKDSFEFLEDKVSKGTLRYYGISSNTIALNSKLSLDFKKVIKIAESVSSNHHFRFLQTPYNLFENHATRKNYGEQSLVDIAHSISIKILGNRPINAHTENGPVRLATYLDDISSLNPNDDALLFADLLKLFEQEFKKSEMPFQIEDYPILEHLSEKWMNIGNPEAVDVLFYEHLLPFMHALYPNQIPQNAMSVFNKVREKAILYSKKLITDQTVTIDKEFKARKVLESSDEPFTNRVISSYLKDGIDHVLIGCKNEGYVQEIHNFFKR